MIGIRTIVLAVLLSAASALVACGDPLGPADLAGDFVLTRVGATAIPGTLRVTHQLEAVIEYDSVTLRADGTARTAQRAQLLFASSAVPTLTVQAFEWVYEIQGPIGRIKLSQAPCPPGMLCAASLRAPLYFTMRGRTLVREEYAGTQLATWTRSDPTAAQ